MKFVVPDIEGTDDAREAVLRFRREVPDPMFLWSGLLRQPFDNAANVMRGLQANTDQLGPVLRAVPRDGDGFLVGVSEVPEGRGVVSVSLPTTKPSPVDPGSWGSVRARGPVVPYALAEVTAAVGIAYALAERASQLADREERVRQNQWLRDEAGEIEVFAVRLEDRIPDLGEQWRAAAGQHSPGPARPATKPVNLR